MKIFLSPTFYYVYIYRIFFYSFLIQTCSFFNSICRTGGISQGPSAVVVTYMLSIKLNLLCPEASLMSNIQFNTIVIVLGQLGLWRPSLLICRAGSFTKLYQMSRQDFQELNFKNENLPTCEHMLSNTNEDITACSGSFPSQTDLVKPKKNADETLILWRTQHISMRTALWHLMLFLPLLQFPS